jgi:peptide chain release factor 2
MVEYDDIKMQLSALAPKLDELTRALDIDAIDAEIASLEEQSAADGFWNDTANSSKVLQKLSSLKNKKSSLQSLTGRFEDAQVLIEMAEEMEDASLVDEAQENVTTLENDLSAALMQTLLSGEYDGRSAIVTLHAGAGGTEAQDWVEMLYRMYMRWTERHGYKFNLLDMLEGDEAGLKSVSFEVVGENAYGYLKSEAGVHRLVRVSPFDASGRRQTSFASLEIVPEIDETIKVDINPDDIRIDTYRSSGAGGQKVNKTSSAIRITHLPTGIVVCCQNERSQHQNKDMAMKMLMSKLMEIKEREHLEKIDDIKGEQKQIGWGSQIRSYVFMPYTLAKDHRTNFEMGNIGAVMDGDLDGFINAYLTALSQGKI